MEHKSWLWKKKSMEKTMIAADKVNRGNEDELQGILAYEAELERNLNISNEKLANALSEINTKDDIAKKQTNIAREAIQGWEKAESEVLALKQELEKTTQQTVASEERLYGVDAALKECMQQLRFVREEQEKRIHDAVIKTSREYEKTRIIIEEKLSESNKKLSKLTSENTQLTKALLAKEKIIDELHTARAQVDSDLSSVMSQLESTQRDNASLSYEVRVLEKELELRNEERDFNRRTADVAHKQHLESVKKISKLETEAQRLRLLVRKRLPGPAALTKMKNEVEMLGRDPAENTKRRSYPFPIASDSSVKRINFLTEQLCALEEENKILKKLLDQKTNESSKNHDYSMHSSLSDMGSDEKASMVESWAPSCKTVGALDIDLMDDFVEMEKLAIVSVENLFTNSSIVSENHSGWLDNISKVVSEHARITQRRSSDILEDIIVALAGKNDNNLRNGYISEENQGLEKSLEHEVEIPSKNSYINGSIQRLIELIEGIRLSGKDHKTSETPAGYTVRVLQWKTSELGAVLETFLQSCNSLINGDADFDNFAKELTLTLEWIVDHCFSIQDVSSMRDEMKKHFDWDENESMEEIQMNLREEAKKLKADMEIMESEKMSLEQRLESEIFKSESLIIKLEESEKMNGSLESEVESLKKQKDMIEDQMKVNMKVKEDLDEQLIEAIGEYNEDYEKLNNDSGSNDEPEDRNLDESLVPESVTQQDIQNHELDNDEKRLQSEREITAATEKLAECQETVLNLGKQLKALASPKHTSIPDKLIITNPAFEPPSSPLPDKKRISLLDKMMAEDLQSAKTKEIIISNNSNHVKSPQGVLSLNGIKHNKDEEALVNFLSVVPKKKKKSGLLRILLWRRKRSNK